MDSTATTPAMNTPATSAAPSVVERPAVKLPLAARKNLRDEWESKRPECEEKISEILETKWTCPVDFTTVWPYLNEDDEYARRVPGSLTYDHMSALIEHLTKFKDQHGEMGIKELNAVASAHTVIIAPTEDPEITRSGTDITDGALRIVFRPGNLGTNIDDAAASLSVTVNKESLASSAGDASSALDFQARSDIARNWDAKLPKLTQSFQEVLNLPVFTLSPNFEANAAKLAAWDKAHRKGTYTLRDDWLQRFGEHTYEYFEGALEMLKYRKFDEDDMLKEGFAEAIEKNEISLQVADSLKRRSYNEAEVVEGVLIMRTVPESWTSNITDVLEDVIDLL